MKNFTTAEIRDLYHQLCRKEISFTRMVEIMNEKVNKAEKPIRKFKKGDKVRIKDGVSSKIHESVCLLFVKSMDEFIGKTMTVSRYAYGSNYIECEGICWRFHEDWLEPYSEPQYKNGDFVVGFGCIFIVHKQIDENSVKYHVLYAKTDGKLWYNKIYWQGGGIDKSKLATEAEKQEFLDALAKEGKRWNAEKKCVEDIPKPKFKVGDKVRIKHGVSSETVHGQDPVFQPFMDDFIGTTMTVDRYDDMFGYVICNESYWRFNEDWLEPCVEDIPKRKFKKGDKVRIKHGVSSKMHDNFAPSFMKEMDNLIGKTMTVERYSDWNNYVKCEGTVYSFLEEWLEPYVEELKKGDLAIFWDDNKDCALIRIYNVKGYSHHSDSYGHLWENAIKFESKKQYEKLIKGEI